MNLFRSEDHARNWDRYDDTMAASLRPVAEWADIFSNVYFRSRGRPDFVSWAKSEAGIEAFAELRRRARS
ncbi:MAG: hypothetical protein P1T08_03785 [Acidimicrobiia bacterium]|nr:hypothetical protein [Acidimicrobiia bacterium]